MGRGSSEEDWEVPIALGQVEGGARAGPWSTRLAGPEDDAPWGTCRADGRDLMGWGGACRIE